MKKYTFTVVLIGIVLIGWQLIEKKSPHQPIEKEQISGVFLWTEASDIKPVSKEDYSSVVDLFNEYDSDRVNQVEFPLQSNAKLIIDLNTAKTITISYFDGKIYVNRIDVDNGEYVFLDNANELEGFFKQLLE
ncbi:hypothetical protein IM538_03835 [Cytobacillus suaedae]|nr:hypothetical protein IM538_03835 [Cytobacillus suaedae]